MATPSTPQRASRSSCRLVCSSSRGQQARFIRQQPLAHSAAEVARDERPADVPERAPPARIRLCVQGAPDPSAVEHVAMPFGGQEADLR